MKGGNSGGRSLSMVWWMQAQEELSVASGVFKPSRPASASELMSLRRARRGEFLTRRNEGGM